MCGWYGWHGGGMCDTGWAHGGKIKIFLHFPIMCVAYPTEWSLAEIMVMLMLVPHGAFSSRFH